MEIVEKILGTYVPLCCFSVPVLGFFALVAALPVIFVSLTSQQSQEEKGSKE